MKIKKFSKNKGVFIWITGLSGSGKSTLAKKIYPNVQKKIGPTILINGDDLRKSFKLYGYNLNDRIENARKFSKLFKLITNQNISILFAAVGIKKKIRSIFKRSLNNYFEIYIESDIQKIKKKNKKKIYQKFKSNVVGLDITPEFPKKPDIKIRNNLKVNINQLNQKLIKRLNKFKFMFK